MLMGKLKSREVLQLVKHFWFFTAKQYCSFLLQLQWMGPFLNCVWKPWNPNRFQEVIWTRFKEEILI